MTREEEKLEMERVKIYSPEQGKMWEEIERENQESSEEWINSLFARGRNAKGPRTDMVSSEWVPEGYEGFAKTEKPLISSGPDKQEQTKAKGCAASGVFVLISVGVLYTLLLS